VVSALSPEELRAFDTALAKLTETAERIAAARPVAEKTDRRHGGARRLRQDAFNPATGASARNK
jgi:hypothetical protein